MLFSSLFQVLYIIKSNFKYPLILLFLVNSCDLTLHFKYHAVFKLIWRYYTDICGFFKKHSFLCLLCDIKLYFILHVYVLD